MLKEHLKIITSLGAVILISACASSMNKPLDPNMTCDQIVQELKTLETEMANAPQNAEINRTVDTGTSVAVQGASIAGVPYIGAVFGIGKTLMNHNKQSTKARAETIENRFYALENMTYEKGCL